MKIRLLNDSGYAGFDGVTFPVEVEARRTYYGVIVSKSELKRIGFDINVPLFFFAYNEFIL